MSARGIVAGEIAAASGGAGPPAIELDGLTKVYGRGSSALMAVDGVTLEVDAGQVFGFLGPNGAGKTTTIKMIAGLVTPTRGRARLHGYDVGRQRSLAVRRIGAVLEGSRNVYWSLSAWQNLLYFGRLRGLPGREIKPRAESLLRELGLWERRAQLVGEFSRGMQQKVAIAAALITDPSILLLDEPTIGLDVEASRTVKDWITQLATGGKTIVLTTHQLEVAQELCDRVAVIRGGRIVTDLPTTELLGRYAEDRYRVRVTGHVDRAEHGVPEGTQVGVDNGTTQLTLPSTNADELHRLLAHLRWRELPLQSVEQVRPDLEEVYLRLIREQR